MDPLHDLFARRVLFVTGKGGVGKSSIAAALAALGAERGLRVLLVDVEAKGDASRFLEAPPPRYRAHEVRPGLAQLAMHPEDILDEYLQITLKLPRVYRLGPLRRVFEFIATAAPGVAEVLIAGKIGFEERARSDGRPRWDLIVVDAAPTGQVLSHIRGPRTLEELVKVGLIRNQTLWVQEILENPKKTGIVVVALPEEMPVAETAELLERAPIQVRTPILALVANRVVREPVGMREIRGLGRQQAKASKAIGVSVKPAVEAATLLAKVAANQAPYVQRLRNLGPPVIEVPYFPVTSHTSATTDAIARALERKET